MSIGARVRAMFGPYEPAISDLWRSMFVDVPDWTRKVRQWAPEATRILEVGCGEGYSTARLAEAYPHCRIDAVDIAENIGRLYDGPPSSAQFRIVTAEQLATETPAAYDLVVLSDVLHHVPSRERVSLLAAIYTLLRPGGMLAVKDWHRDRTAPIHWAVYCSDRWLTGDAGVNYIRCDEARALIGSVFGRDSIQDEATIRPWRNNYAFRVRRA